MPHLLKLQGAAPPIELQEVAIPAAHEEDGWDGAWWTVVADVYLAARASSGFSVVDFAVAVAEDPHAPKLLTTLWTRNAGLEESALLTTPLSSTR